MKTKVLSLTILMVWAFGCAHAAITLHGKTTEADSGVTAVASVTITNTGQAVSAGDCLVVSVRSGVTTANQITVSDNVNSGNYAKVGETIDSTNGRSVGRYVKASGAVAAGSLTITIAVSPNNTLAGNGLIYTGASATCASDGYNGAVFSTATSTPSSGNITTTVSGDAVIGSFGISTAATVTVSSEGGSFAQEFNDTVGTANHQHLHTAAQILAGTSTLAYAPTLSSTTTGVIDVMALQPAAAASTGGFSKRAKLDKLEQLE